MVLVKNCPFFNLFFCCCCFGNIDQEDVFCNIQERTKAFLVYKNKKFKKSTKWDFSKRVNLWFWSKIGHFPCFFREYRMRKLPFFQSVSLFFSSNIDQENVFYDILERNTTFLIYKSNKFKKSKNWKFSKRVNPWFWLQIGNFSMFFYGNIDRENVF